MFIRTLDVNRSVSFLWYLRFLWNFLPVYFVPFSLSVSLCLSLPPLPHSQFDFLGNFLCFPGYPHLSVSQKVHSIIVFCSALCEDLTHITILSLPFFPPPSNQQDYTLYLVKALSVLRHLSIFQSSHSLHQCPCHHCAPGESPTLKSGCMKVNLFC